LEIRRRISADTRSTLLSQFAGASGRMEEWGQGGFVTFRETQLSLRRKNQVGNMMEERRRIAK